MSIERETAAALAPERASLAWVATVCAVLALTAMRLLWLAALPTDLYPDEAQYWLWSRHLAFGYYSKPPLVAWLIALSTAFFGNSELAIRLSAPLLHAFAALFVYGIGSRLYDHRVGCWSALAYFTLPGVSLSSFIMSTDAVLLPCWTAALYAFIRAREDGRIGWWVVAGIAMGAGLLAKYAMAYFFLSGFAFVLFYRSERRHLRGFAAASAVALLVAFPNLWWNWRNGFASFGAVEKNAELGGTLFHPLAFLSFLGSQFAVFGPLFFSLLLWLLARPRELADSRSRLLVAFTLPTLLVVLAVSLASRAHANWAAPAYVAATVLVVGTALEWGWRSFVPVSIALHLVSVVLIFGGAELVPAFGINLPARYDPLHRLEGWHALGERVGRVLAQHKGYRLLADDREALAALVYYVHPHPFDAVHWDPMRRVRNEWELKNDLSRYPGRNFLVVSMHHLVSEMRPDFAAITPLGHLVIPIGPGLERRYSLYLARDFRGYLRDRR
jgi:4-amino-4-deoxy-L-arabinose transferase-like glycosyltransferase